MDISKWAFRNRNLIYFLIAVLLLGGAYSCYQMSKLEDLMDAYLEQNGYVNDMNMERLHHEIYLSDARKVAPEKWKTVIRHPIKKL